MGKRHRPKAGRHRQDSDSIDAEKLQAGKSSRTGARKAIKPGWLSSPARSYLLFSIGAMATLLAIIFFMLFKSATTGSEGVFVSAKASDQGYFAGEKVKVEFYVMSQCPYGTQVEDAIAPVLERLGGAVDFKIDYISRELSPGVFQSLHGEPETTGNIAQLCVVKNYPQTFMALITCQNKDPANVDTNWEECASKLGMDSGKIRSCITGAEGKSLLSESVKRTAARQASASPTIFINDAPYNGPRDSLSLQRAICKYSSHPECKDLPACASDSDCTDQPSKDAYCLNPGSRAAVCEYKDPARLEYIILNQDACGSCDTTRVVQVTQQLFKGAVSRVVDLDSAEGKALAAKYNIALLPAFIFDSSVKNAKAWVEAPELETAFNMHSDGKYSLKPEVVGATYFVSEESRLAYYSAIGVVKGDNRPQIDFFVMSYCPYGNQAEEGIAPVFELLQGSADFKPHYVLYPNYAGGGPDYCIAGGEICSMHGIVELNQNIREACALKYFGEKAWFDFALAMNKECNTLNADSCWKPVALGLGIDAGRIGECQIEEGEALMRQDLELGSRLGVQGSPTVFIDGDIYNGGRSPESYKTGLCLSFESPPPDCSVRLAGEAVASAPAAGCGV